jgi:hypothetical protein
LKASLDAAPSVIIECSLVFTARVHKTGLRRFRRFAITIAQDDAAFVYAKTPYSVELRVTALRRRAKVHTAT